MASAKESMIRQERCNNESLASIRIQKKTLSTCSSPRSSTSPPKTSGGVLSDDNEVFIIKGSDIPDYLRSNGE